ncbi:Chaperone HSP104 [Handroanthus impetiginosus]|uniref:Chaperone HSP104 n=1 Tax=Handroanthus impetiginosus TaxID=429701 RepID=A0A2G9GB32_9LAMI|nr:Chaperone HSP104 [Handroanthus impetiginosus]
MPTPVSAARQCLTEEAAAVLDDAVAIARRRGHAQTTSLHMVSSLLSLPNSSLRESCTRTRNNAYSSRVQFKALELSLSVSLDRFPSSQANRVEEPPVSNSLMAAIKRSQANQRRQPENFTFYQQQQQQQQYSSGSSVPVVKVELQNLILSILDDPLVSRVFGEAGFRSCDIKMATLRPGNSFHPPHLFGYTSRYKRQNPPLYLCNLSSRDNISEVGSKGFSFPFMGCFYGDENSRRIGEIMLREKKRNPLLLGVAACDALRSFLEIVQRKMKGVLPDGLSGLSVVCVKDEILRYLSGDRDEGPLKLRFEEVERMVENVVGGGVVVNLGDLKAFVGDSTSIDGLRHLASKMAKFLEVYGGKLWLIGAAETDETYSNILNKIPTIKEDWNLEVLPITSHKFSIGGSYPRSSLMESFVPLGGFFSMPPETISASNNDGQYGIRCHLCNEKYEQEVAALSKGEFNALFAQQQQSSLPSWLQQSGFSSIKGKDDRLLLNAKIMGLKKKWDSICQQHHHFNQSLSKFPRFVGFEVAHQKKEVAQDGKENSNESSNEQGNKNASSSLSGLRQSSSLKELSSLDMLSKANNMSILSKSGEVSESKGLSSSCLHEGRTSPTSVTSVTTDLGLSIISASTRREPEKSSSFICQDIPVQSYVKDPKLLYRALVEKVGQQEEAIRAIIETITQRRTTNTDIHRNIWISLRGPDGLSKKKLGLALAEALFGSAESFIYVDLSFQDEIMTYADNLFNSQVKNKYDLTMRGTVVDYLVEKLRKKPSIVFLENIDKADLVVQNSLSQAVKTGRFMDLHRREVNIRNCIFLGTTEGGQSMKNSTIYTEEDVLRTKGSSIQISVIFDLNNDPMTENLHHLDPTRKEFSDMLMNKRKLVGRSENTGKRAHKESNSFLDLNLPAEGSEICSEKSDSDSTSDNSRSWLEDFDAQIDQIVVFKPFDFDILAEKLFKDMSECLNNTFGSECSIEIERKVMQQILAAAYLFGNKRVEDWIFNVLSGGFSEAMGKFSLNAQSIVKLGTFEDAVSEGLLPDRIVMK